MFGSKVRQVQDLVAGLDPGAYEIEVCGVDVDDEASDALKSLGIPMFRLVLHPPFLLNPRRSLSLSTWAQFVAAPFRLRHRQFDIVHSLCYQSIFTEALIVRWFTSGRPSFR